MDLTSQGATVFFFVLLAALVGTRIGKTRVKGSIFGLIFGVVIIVLGIYIFGLKEAHTGIVIIEPMIK